MKKMFFAACACALALLILAGCAGKTVTKVPLRGESCAESVPPKATAPVESAAPSEESAAPSEESAAPSEESAASPEETSKEPEYRSGDYVYTLTNDVAKLVEYLGGESELTLPDELEGHPLTALKSGAFRKADKLKKLILSDSVVNVGEGALSGCTALESLSVGGGAAVLSVSDLAACGCLSEIRVQPVNAVFSSREGVLYNREGTVLLLCPRALKAEKLSLPQELELIGENAFAECRGVGEVLLPEGCALSAFSFFHCTSLKSVHLPEGLAAIPEKCFFGCVRLTEITVPEGVSEIGKLAFFGCVALKTVSLPSTLGAVGEDAFKCCSALKKIDVKGEYGKNWYDKFGKALISGKKT